MSWQALNLAAPDYAQRSEPPNLCGLVYAGKRHLVSGPPEANKTMFALIVGLELVRSGGTFALLDFESGPYATRLMLEELGATLEEIASVYYVEPDTAPKCEQVDELLAEGVSLAVIDASVGAYGASALDDNKRADAEIFGVEWIDPLWHGGITTVLLDHVVKSTESRGRFAIGSERKAGRTDVHLGLDAITQITRGGVGLVKITTHKDRPGWLTRPTAAMLELNSDVDTHQIAWRFKPPEGASRGGFHPTVLMTRISTFLEAQETAVSMNTVESASLGKSREWIRRGVTDLITAGYITEERGPRGARMLTLARPFTSPDLAPTSPGEVVGDFAYLARPLQGGEVAGEVDTASANGDLAPNLGTASLAELQALVDRGALR